MAKSCKVVPDGHKAIEAAASHCWWKKATCDKGRDTGATFPITPFAATQRIVAACDLSRRAIVCGPHKYGIAPHAGTVQRCCDILNSSVDYRDHCIESITLLQIEIVHRTILIRCLYRTMCILQS